MRNVVRYILLIANLAFVVLLLISAAIRLFHNEPPWIFELVSLGYPYYMGISIAFMFFWIVMRKWWYVLLLLATMALSSAPFFDTFGFGSSRKIQETDDTMTVLTFNVNAFNYMGWSERGFVQGEFFDFVKQSQPDVVCLQEFHYDKKEKYQLIDSLQSIGLRYWKTHQIHSIKNRYFYGTVVFSRYPIVDYGTLTYPNSGNSSQWVDIVRNADTLRVYNNHLESYRLQSQNFETIEQVASGQEFEVAEVKNVLQKMIVAMQKRNTQAIILRKSLHECPYRMIVCGDFNAPAYSFIYHTIQEEHNLHDAFIETSKGVGGTYHWKFLSKRIDFILTHPDFMPVSCKVPNLIISDHYPVLAKLVVND
ncbi:MAG: endonuclease/exonuclease/phosphatase family protein [Bacteroidales bacterium]|jgi:endonuclease/exonuclease/phosphatase family metal-dependent hydrolase|nr:endonuclease/exonuclease/phosphatase family protein [Bacteroidales bacterium]